MKKIFYFAFLILVLGSFNYEETFKGKIVYKCTYTDLKGNDVSDKLAPLLGKEQRYFMDDKNYKALDENNNYMQLYNSATNTFYFFTKDKMAQKFDGATETAKNVKVTNLDQKEKIAGYDCKSLQVETENSTIVYYFSPLVKTDPKTYEKHKFGEYDQFMKASGGALPLKFTVTDHKNGVIMTFVATEIKKMKITPKEFEFPAGYQIKTN